MTIGRRGRRLVGCRTSSAGTGRCRPYQDARRNGMGTMVGIGRCCLAMIAGALMILPAMAAQDGAAQDGAVIRLAQEPGREVGVACRYLDLDQRPMPPEVVTLCEDAADLVARKLSGLGRSVVRSCWWFWRGVRTGTAPVIPACCCAPVRFVTVSPPRRSACRRLRSNWVERAGRRRPTGRWSGWSNFL